VQNLELENLLQTVINKNKKGRNMNVLDKIMKPKSIAVVGASTKPKTIGSEIMQRLRDYKFNGSVYPVNPKGGMIEGFQAYTSIAEIPGEVDLAIIVVNSKFVLSSIPNSSHIFLLLSAYPYAGDCSPEKQVP